MVKLKSFSVFNEWSILGTGNGPLIFKRHDFAYSCVGKFSDVNEAQIIYSEFLKQTVSIYLK